MTPEQRKELITKLCSDWIFSVREDSRFIWDIARLGHKGFENYTDEELLADHREAFDEDFLT
jgi:hypothetical protein